MASNAVVRKISLWLVRWEGGGEDVCCILPGKYRLRVWSGFIGLSVGAMAEKVFADLFGFLSITYAENISAAVLLLLYGQSLGSLHFQLKVKTATSSHHARFTCVRPQHLAVGLRETFSCFDICTCLIKLFSHVASGVTGCISGRNPVCRCPVIKEKGDWCSATGFRWECDDYRG